VTSGNRYATTTFWKVEKWNSIQYSWYNISLKTIS
jgi:hypothetical protein